MEGFYVLLFALVVSSVSAQAPDCMDQSKLLCSLRKADCSRVKRIRDLCPASCGTCSGNPVYVKVYNLTYFDAPRRAEQIRWILAQADAKWIDTRISVADFPVLSDWRALKPKTLTGQLPYLEVEGTTIAQSGAIAMYIGREFGLAGINSLEEAQVHMIWDMCQEAYNAFSPIELLQNATEKEIRLKNYYDTELTRFIGFLEKVMKPGAEWLVGNRLTLADIVSASLFQKQTGDGTALIQNSKTASALHAKVVALPRIKTWMNAHP